MRILSIGNSFSVDCQRYVREIAGCDGYSIELGNLYIGGCSLETHFSNIVSEKPAYDYYENNVLLGKASVQTALKDKQWDVITLQQASHFSGMEETYYPYLTDIAAYVRNAVPEAKLCLNQTWAYEYNSKHPAFSDYHNDRREMHDRLTKCYINAAIKIKAGIIPVGNAIHAARELMEFDPELGGYQLSRDGFHLGFFLGRYMASAVWYEVLTGNSIMNNKYIPMEREYTGKDSAGRVITRPLPETQPDSRLLALAREVCHNTSVSAAELLDIWG